MNIPKHLIKNKFDINHQNVTITQAENGIFTIDTTTSIILNKTFSDVSIYELNNNHFLITYSYQAVKSAAEIKHWVDKNFILYKSNIKALNALGVDSKNYKIIKESNPNYPFYETEEIVFNKQKIPVGRKIKMYAECPNYILIQ